MKKDFFVKGVAENLDYGIDWGSGELFQLEDTITSSSWIVPSETVDDVDNETILLSDDVTANFSESSPSPVYVLGGTEFSSTISKIFISSGTSGKSYTLENRIITQAGRKYSQQIIIKIE